MVCKTPTGTSLNSGSCEVEILLPNNCEVSLCGNTNYEHLLHSKRMEHFLDSTARGNNIP